MVLGSSYRSDPREAEIIANLNTINSLPLVPFLERDERTFVIASTENTSLQGEEEGDRGTNSEREIIPFSSLSSSSNQMVVDEDCESWSVDDVEPLDV